MAPRRRIFNEQYGTSKGEQSKGGGKLPPPQTAAKVPLSFAPQGQPMPVQPNTQLGGQTMPGVNGQPEGIEELLRQLLMRFGGTNA